MSGGGAWLGRRLGGRGDGRRGGRGCRRGRGGRRRLRLGVRGRRQQHGHREQSTEVDHGVLLWARPALPPKDFDVVELGAVGAAGDETGAADPSEVRELQVENGFLVDRDPDLATVHRDADSWTAEEAEAFKAPVRDRYEAEGSPYYATARLWDDGVLLPEQTRDALGLALSTTLNAPIPDRAQFGIFRM